MSYFYKGSTGFIALMWIRMSLEVSVSMFPYQVSHIGLIPGGLMLILGALANLTM